MTRESGKPLGTGLGHPPLRYTIRTFQVNLVTEESLFDYDVNAVRKSIALPNSTHTSRALFTEIAADEDSCVCSYRCKSSRPGHFFG